MRFQFLLTVDWRVHLYTPNPQTNFHLCAWDSPYLPSEVVSRWQINKKYFFSPSYLAHRYTLLFCKLRVGSYMEIGFCPTVKSRNLQAIKKYQKDDWAITKNAGMWQRIFSSRRLRERVTAQCSLYLCEEGSSLVLVGMKDGLQLKTSQRLSLTRLFVKLWNRSERSFLAESIVSCDLFCCSLCSFLARNFSWMAIRFFFFIKAIAIW